MDGTLLYFKKLSPAATSPVRGTEFSAGLDLFASESKIIKKRASTVVKTDVAVMLPSGSFGKIMGRSSLALHGIDVGGGVIDTDYRGEIKVILFNHSDREFKIEWE